MFKIKAVLNADCSNPLCNSNVTVVHVTATSETDIIHQLWDFAGTPTVLIAITPLNTSVSIDWTSLDKKTGNYVQFSSPPIYSSSLVLNRVCLEFEF